MCLYDGERVRPRRNASHRTDSLMTIGCALIR
jgi:hypothetical protein